MNLLKVMADRPPLNVRSITACDRCDGRTSVSNRCYRRHFLFNIAAIVKRTNRCPGSGKCAAAGFLTAVNDCVEVRCLRVETFCCLKRKEKKKKKEKRK